MTDITRLETKRAELLEKLAMTGYMRRGSITENYRPCGKPTCACADPSHAGHGPYYAYTIKVDGKTRTRQMRPGPALEKLEREVAMGRVFRTTCDELFQVNEALCDGRPADLKARAALRGDVSRGHHGLVLSKQQCRRARARAYPPGPPHTGLTFLTCARLILIFELG